MLVAFSITPLGVGESVGGSVAEAVALVRQSGLPNQTNAMFTNVEGEWDEVMDLIHACMEKMSESAPRLSVVIKIDQRPGVHDALTTKVASVESHLRPRRSEPGPTSEPGPAPDRGDGVPTGNRSPAP
jgi:uncharacterized protein (TIGR00106 family)